jgi:excisionase family DNA binding protein
VSTFTQRHDDARERLLNELFPGGDFVGKSDGRFLRTREVALLFQVSERAVTDWARKGRIASVRTPGGHRRYPAEPIRDALASHGGDGAGS